MGIQESDCTYLIMPISLAVLVRVVISMGVIGELRGLYAIVSFFLTFLVSYELSTFPTPNYNFCYVQD